MRTSSDDFFIQKKSNNTLDSQIEFFKKDNKIFENDSTPKPSTNKVQKQTKNSDEFTKFLKDLEKAFKKIDESVSTQSFFRYAQTPDEANNFIKHLISPLKKLTPHEELTLFYFLQTAISYTVKFSPENECNLETLVFLAITTRDDSTKDYIDDSLFDVLIKEDLIKSDYNSCLDLRLCYERFCKNKSKDTSQIILKNILKIAKNYKPYKQ